MIINPFADGNPVNAATHAYPINTTTKINAFFSEALISPIFSNSRSKYSELSKPFSDLYINCSKNIEINEKPIIGQLCAKKDTYVIVIDGSTIWHACSITDASTGL